MLESDYSVLTSTDAPSMKMDSENDFNRFRDYYSEGYTSDYDERDDETASERSVSSDFFNETYYQEEEEGGLNSDDDDGDDQTGSNSPDSNYAVINQEEICQRLEKAVDTVQSFLSVSPNDAGILLRTLKWSVSTINERWFADEALVRQIVGLPIKPSSEDSRIFPPQEDFHNRIDSPHEVECPLCCERFLASRMVAPLVCGHRSCQACWTRYIHYAISSGPACLILRCAQPCCGVAVGEDMILAFADEEDRSRYARYQQNSYVEFNRKAKWCPAPGCEYAVVYTHSPGPNNHDVVCKCGHNFCWNCLEESHRPVDCETVAKWNSSVPLGWELQFPCPECKWPDNLDWLMANKKPCPTCGRYNKWRNVLVDLKQCPECKRPIQKDRGCDHMTCPSPCGFDFCWRCLSPWIGLHNCNCPNEARTEEASSRGSSQVDFDSDDIVVRRPVSPEESRFKLHFERWVACGRDRAGVLSYIQERSTEDIEWLSYLQSRPTCELEFLREAWLQIADCQQMLKWTYPYGFYHPDDGSLKRQHFNCLVEEEEALLERLRFCAQTEIRPFMRGDGLPGIFLDFKTKLITLTFVTRAQFNRNVRLLEHGLEDFIDSNHSREGVVVNHSAGTTCQAGH